MLARHLEPHLGVPIITAPLIYFASGVIGSLASANLDAEYIVTGASNAVCGLIGALHRYGAQFNKEYSLYPRI